MSVETNRFDDLAAKLDADMVRVEAGPFPYGLTDVQRRAAAKTAGVHPDQLHFHSRSLTAVTPEFWIDRYPVTRAQFLRFCRETDHRMPYNGWLVGWTELTDIRDVSDPAAAVAPVVGVNAADAEAYAAWAGKRLATDIEWEKAARGADGRLCPWGDDASQHCSPGGLPLTDLPPVGSSGSVSPCGARDMCALVCEWVRRTIAPASPDGSAVDTFAHVLAGGSMLHVQPYSHYATNRLSWHPAMRIYTSGFRCVADTPPAEPAPADLPDAGRAVEPVGIDAGAFGRDAIRIEPTETTTVRIHVPWFPRGMWVLDCPESSWPPFGGANDWPDGPESAWRVDWRQEGVSDARYRREADGRRVGFDIAAEGDLVRYEMRVEGVSGYLGGLCLKTLSAQFSSQERLTQCKWSDGELVRCCDLPLDASNAKSLGWTLGDVEDGMIVMRSYDGGGYVVLFGPPGCGTWGNGWPHCTHFEGDAGRFTDRVRCAILFFVGSEAELRRRVEPIRRELDGA